MTSATRPGWKTSEFWVLLGSAAVSILATTGMISQSTAHNLTMETPAIISYISTGAAAVVYILSRSGLKWRWLSVAAQDLGTPADLPTDPLPDSPPSPSYGTPNGTTPAQPAPSSASSI